MSASMYWEPAKRPLVSLPYGFQRAAAPTWFRQDGSISSERYTADSSDLLFLEGMAAAGSPEVKEGARMLIEAIQQHGQIEVWIER